jgi:hypothetical protein
MRSRLGAGIVGVDPLWPRRFGLVRRLGWVSGVGPDQLPLQPLLTLEGGRPRSRAENKIGTQLEPTLPADLDFLSGLPP